MDRLEFKVYVVKKSRHEILNFVYPLHSMLELRRRMLYSNRIKTRSNMYVKKDFLYFRETALLPAY